MLDSTIELISLVASNSLAVFCFCNLIIAILLAGSTKPNSKFHQEEPYDYDNLKKYTVYSCEKTNALIDIDEEQKVSYLSMHMIGNEEASPDEEKQEEEEDDELRKRVEDFIEKINTIWRAEKLNTYSLRNFKGSNPDT